MADRLKEIPGRLLAWWGRFTSRQKSIIIGIAAVVIFTFAIIIYALSKPQYTRLTSCDSIADAAKVVDILESAGIKHRESSDGLRIEVETSQLSAANIAIGSAGYVPDDYNYDGYMSSGLTTTATDSSRRYAEYLSNKLSIDLTNFASVLGAKVHIDLADNDGTLLAQTRESSAYIQLQTDGNMSTGQATNIAQAVRVFLGNETTANITIVDQNANMLFSGGDDYSAAGIAGSMQELQNQAEAMVSNQVRNVMYNLHLYDMVEVSSHLPVDFNSYDKTIKTYSVAEGREEAYLAKRQTYNEETVNNGSGAPGTSSNDGTVEVWPDNSNSHTTISEVAEDFLPNEEIENILTNSGAINYSDASMGVSLLRYREIREEDVERRGELEGMSWEEYKFNNGADVMVEVPEEFYSLVSNATGIPANAITIVAYEKPVFYDAPGSAITPTAVGSVLLFIVILALLAFVVLRSMIVRRADQEEEEISVEDLLQSTPEPDLEEIGEESKSEARKIIEKFVDENPESVAILLRNWLNEDWG